MRKNNQHGFTLVELLVVIGIMATLAAVVLPSVGRFVKPGHDAAEDEEIVRVQAAMDMFIAETKPSPPTVAENTTGANDFSATNPVLYPDYLRDRTTRCLYTWDTTGRISLDSCP